MISVVAPGARTLVQDAGRVGYEHLGIPTSGAADLPSLAIANRLVGNPENAAALEVSLHGPTLTFACDTVVGYAGADTDLTLDGTPVPVRHTLPVRAGQTVSVGGLRGGVFGYLSVRGGIATDPVLGSRSTCTLSGLGTPALTAGARLDVGQAGHPVGYLAARSTPPPSPVVRYLPGPHTNLFSADAHARLEGHLWQVSPASSRVGVRLEGGGLDAPQGSVPSLGMVPGAIQVPPTGHPIVLGPDHGTTGGYPVIGVVIPADLPGLLQRTPGTAVRFTPVSRAQAHAAEMEDRLRMDRSLLRLDRVSA